MDFVFHAVLGATIAKGLTGDHALAGAIFATAPDFIGISYYEFEKIKYASKDSKKKFLSDFVKYSKTDSFFKTRGVLVYRSTHNIFAWMIATAIAWILFGNIFWVFSLCYFSHLFVDSYTHKNDSALRPFFPISDYKIEGVTWSSSLNVFALHWLLLILLLFISL